MKTKDIAQKYGIDQNEFEEYLQRQKIAVQYTFMGAMVLESDIDEHVKNYIDFKNQEKNRKEAWEKEKLEFDRRMKEINEWAKQQALEAEKKKKQEEIEKQRKLNSILTTFSTTGFNFEGYNIVSYKGIVNGQVVLGTGFLSELNASFADFCGSQSDKFADKLEKAKGAAMRRMVEKAVKQGGNAIIGIDFDYITFSNNMVGVVANGTAVVIEKQDNAVS